MIARFRITGAIVLALLLCAPAWAGQLVVIASTHADLEPGSVVPAGQTLRLESGQSITLVSNDGRVYRLTGPYRGPAVADAPAGASGNALVETLSNLVKDATSGVRTLAVFRGAGARDAVWLIRMHSPGTHCTTPEADPRFFRSRSSGDGRLTVSRRHPPEEVTSTWPAGQSRLAWPSAMAVTYAAAYTAELRDARGTAVVNIHALPQGLPSEIHRVAWMAQRGCARQARLLLEIIAREASG